MLNPIHKLHVLHWADEVRDPTPGLGGSLPDRSGAAAQELGTATPEISLICLASILNCIYATDPVAMTAFTPREELHPAWTWWRWTLGRHSPAIMLTVRRSGARFSGL
ncbi:hypothetical protein [Saccharopolyspora shandongensis]|uniref:hypothetical protein n=1 Tax=Saccharopolyspora shandongensis TaxID=418495 RepID=UPI0033D8E936